MGPELFHLWQTANSDRNAAIVIVGVVVLLIVAGVLGYLLHRRRIGPVTIWLVIFLLFFGFAQIFPENRHENILLITAAADAIGSGVITWVIAREVKKHNRAKQIRDESN